MVKLVFFHSRRNLLGKLTRLFTGSYIYHCGILVDSSILLDMYLTPRARLYQSILNDTSNHTVEIELPESVDKSKVLAYFLQTSAKGTLYSITDYMLFAIRPLLDKLSLTAVNTAGLICSEWANECIAYASSYKVVLYPLHKGPPSPNHLFEASK